MQTLTYQQSNNFSPGVMIKSAQPKQADKHQAIRNAVRAWGSAEGQDYVAMMIVEEYRAQGGRDITFPSEINRQRQKLFRFLDNRFDSEQYRENVEQLTPAIMAVLPLTFRTHLMPAGCLATRVANKVKEDSESAQAAMLNAPTHEIVKEASESVYATAVINGHETAAEILIRAIGMCGKEVGAEVLAALLQQQRPVESNYAQ
ncbi:toxin YdaT family protein [Atlantibacter subterranea]|uniref:toxin YdaT family protein n=1 Tax=Atlantibacter subterraneus TaxID=255519 RepID=UPI0020C4F133|nr:toxin YdaT family protein [Atlantibacter subterranea]UTJ46620.1 toxin YdaT family protein [Atlantibacter subterranea]